MSRYGPAEQRTLWMAGINAMLLTGASDVREKEVQQTLGLLAYLQQLTWFGWGGCQGDAF